MKIRNLQITSSTLNFNLDINKSICVLRGENSEIVLDLIRELIGDCDAKNDLNRIDGGHFVIHSDIEMDDKNYNVCYIRNAESMGDSRIAVNFVPNSFDYSKEDTAKFMEKCNKLNIDTSNIIYEFPVKINMEDDRPVFVYMKNKTNDAELNMLLNTIANSGRQVFIALASDHPQINGNNFQNEIIGGLSFISFRLTK